ncbi:glycosyltransferase family 2 protein [Ramlibacter sp.]|uniref:glycosyltransferase family 2 protein n=1 Tax=Ramlibacter sp. TaxID=1917967 RepID=UPI0026173FC0|nr:glycosyltransferase family 2 protein [Ramlibacter sp.]
MPRLSVIVITKNEILNIGDCLRSVAFADEVVVLDSGSTDGTVDLARSLGATVTQSADWPGYGPQKNRALAAASGDWVFSIDADEQVTPELAAQLREAMARGSFDAYMVNRFSNFCGRYMEHSGWYPDRVLRLFRRGTARFSDDIVHERVIADGKVGRLSGKLLHNSMPHFESVLGKLDRYSTAGAQALHARGKKGSFSQALLHGWWAFMRTYVLKLGFLDGQLGLALAISNAEGTYYRYLKLWLMQRKPAASGSQR